MTYFKTKKENGFTLIEILIFMGLFSVILVVLTSLFASTVQQQLETQGMSAVESDSTYIVSRMQYDFDRADDVVLPVDFGDTGDTLTLVVGGQDYTYALNGSNLELTTPTATYRVQGVRTSISDLSFQKIGNSGGKPTVQLQMTITSLAENTTGAETNQIQTIFGIK